MCDEWLLLKSLQCNGDAGAAHTQHHREELLRELQFAVYPVGCHEQPTRKPFFNFAATIGNGRAGNLFQEFVHIAQERLLERWA